VGLPLMSKVLGLIVTVDESDMTALDLKKTSATVTVLPFKPQYPHTNFPHWTPYNAFMNCLKSLIKDSLRASSPGCSGGGAPGIWISASKKSMQEADWRRWHWYWRHYHWHVFFNVCLHSRSFLIGGNPTAQSKGSHRGIGGGIQFPET